MQRAAGDDIAESNPIAGLRVFVENRVLNEWCGIRGVGSGDREGRSWIWPAEVNYDF